MRSFYLILLNNLISGVTTSLLWFSMTIWVYLATHSVFVTSLISGSFMIATMISGFIFGPIVDHHYKRSVMLGADIASLIMIILGFGFYSTTPLSDFSDPYNPNLWLFILPIFLSVIISNIRNTAMPTLTSILVPAKNRDRANGLVGTTTGMTFLIAPMLGGFLLSISGMYWVLVVAILLRLLTITHLYLTHITEKLFRTHGEKFKIKIGETLRIVLGVPGLMALLIFNSINNFIGGVFGPLVDPYGLSLVSQRTWGIISGVLSIGFMIGGMWIAKNGLGKSPLRTLFLTNIIMWLVCIFFAILPSITLLVIGVFTYFCLIPFAEAAEQTIIQKVVAKKYQGRVFGLGQSIESAATPLSTFAVGPLVQFGYIPFMTTGLGAETIGHWFGVGEARGIALLFVTSGAIGLVFTILGMQTQSYRLLSRFYRKS